MSHKSSVIAIATANARTANVMRISSEDVGAVGFTQEQILIDLSTRGLRAAFFAVEIGR